MIGAASDADEYVNAAKEQMAQWNTIYSDLFHITIQPLYWKRDTYPQVGHPQEVIDKSIVSKSQMLIAIFHGKFGSPTKCAESGTIEEINLHIEQGKTVQVYFSKEKPADSSKSDFEKIQKYKESIQDKIFYREYSSVEQFKILLDNNLGQFMKDHISNKGKKLDSEKINKDIQSLIKVWSQSGQEFLHIEEFRNGDVIIRIDKENYTYYCMDVRAKAALKETFEHLIKNDLIQEETDGNGYSRLALTTKGFEYADSLSEDPLFGTKSEEEQND